MNLRRLSMILGVLASLPFSTRCVISASPSSQVDSERFIINAWRTDTGLPQATVNAIIQTRDGYLWLGTYGGLVRFDGVKFTLFHSSNTQELKSIRIRALFEDREGNLWIGTEGGGLTRTRAGTFTTYTIEDGLPRNDVGGIAQDREGYIWVESGSVLVRLEQGRFVTYAPTTEHPLRAVTTPVEDLEGNIWFGTRAGLVRMNSRRQFKIYTIADGLPGDVIQSILLARDGTLWIGTLNGLSHFASNEFTNYTTKEGLSSNYITCLTEDRSGKLWIGTFDSGVNRFASGVFTQFTSKQGLSENRVRAVTEDAEGNIWVGTNTGGLNRIRRAEVISYTRAEGLAADSVVPITEDGEGNLWIGAACGGLIRLRDGRFTSIPVETNTSNCVWSLHAAPDGALWIGTWNGGLTRFKDGQFQTFTDTNAGLSSKVVLAIHQDRNGTLWVGTANGLNRFSEGNVTLYRTSEGLVHDDVRFIKEGRDGVLWIGTYGGFSSFKDGRFTNYSTTNGLSHNFVRAIHEDSDGALWIGTYGGGLNRFKEGKFTRYDTNNGLFDDVVSSILEDERGNLWMSGNKGIFSVRRQELNELAEGRRTTVACVSYDDKDGMVASETNGGGQPAGWRSRDGKLWFPTIKGVVMIDPKYAGTNTLPPPVVIERALFDKRVFDTSRIANVPPGRGNLEIHYTALSFVEPEEVRFKYRLEGYDDDWVDVGARRVAYYTNIPPGEYRFRVIAANDDGVWNETGAAFNLYLAPHFYQTGWFLMLCGIGVVLLGFGGYRLRVHQLLDRAKVLETKVADRTNELQGQRNELAEANTRLAEVNRQVERFNDDMLSVLNRLSVGVLIVDAAGIVTFVSSAAQALLSIKHNELIGTSWEEALPLSDSDRIRVRDLLTQPSSQRGKVPAFVEADDGRRYWMEIEVQDDPRHPERKIFFLSDVSEIYDLRRLRDETTEFKDLVGQSAAMQLVFKQIRDVARVDATVLIEGETGTGKELVARAIHQSSARRSEPFIPVNCAGLTESLLASQLFGHRRGAFTGAIADHTGLFEAATGGTIFLDEIGDVPLSVQTNLLRVLQEKEITRLGETIPRKIDVRIISATHRHLSDSVKEGTFREDLLYRIRVARINIPPLRERSEDIPLLAAWFLNQSRADQGDGRAHDISSDAIRMLTTYYWPGNVRELKSAIEFAIIHCNRTVLGISDLPPEIVGGVTATSIEEADNDEIQRLLDALRRAKGNRTLAARLLGVSRATFYRRLASLGLDKHE